MVYFDLIIKVGLFLVFSELFYSLYLKFKKINIINQDSNIDSRIFFNSFNHFKQKSQDSSLLDPFLSKLMASITFFFSLCLLFLFPIFNYSKEYNLPFNLELIVIILLLIMIIDLLMVIVSQHLNRIQNSKEIVRKITNYLLPIIFAIIAIKITLVKNNISIFSFQTIIEIQNTTSFYIFEHYIPSIFILKNPFSFLAFISSIIGLNRETNLDALPKESIRAWNFMEEIHGKPRGMFELSKAISFFILISLIFPLYLGALWKGENILLNILLLVGINFISIIGLSFIGKGKPRIFLDRKISSFIRIPFLFAIISIIWAFIF